jgi:hypothetical protein
MKQLNRIMVILDDKSSGMIHLLNNKNKTDKSVSFNLLWLHYNTTSLHAPSCCVIQNSIFVSVNITIQVKGISEVIYISVNHNMFQPLLGHHQLYLCVLRSWIFVQYGSIVFFPIDYTIKWLLLSSEPLVSLHISFELYKTTLN